jgi:hypothetical protein
MANIVCGNGVAWFKRACSDDQICEWHGYSFQRLFTSTRAMISAVVAVIG